MNIQEYTRQINQSLTKYKERIDYAFLFGSILKKPLNTSDVDILLGANLNSFEKIDLAMELELILKRKVDVVLAKEAPCELVLKAFSKGLPVMINDKQRLKNDYFKNIHLYEDRNTLRNLRISRIKRKYGYAG
jgi:predicted nucleotidyltransferase